MGSTLRKAPLRPCRFYLPRDLELWEQTFSDPSNSLRTTRTPCWLAALRLSRRQMQKKTVGSKPFPVLYACAWTAQARTLTIQISLAPFHGLSPALKSINVFSTVLSHVQLFGLVHSLPPPEDLTLAAHGSPSTLGIVLFQGLGPTEQSSFSKTYDAMAPGGRPSMDKRFGGGTC